MTTPDWVNISTPREGQQVMASTFGAAEAIVSVSGYTAPYTPVVMVRNGIPVPDTLVTSDGGGFFDTKYDEFGIGTHVVAARAGTAPDTVQSSAVVFSVIPGVEPTFIELNSPGMGSVYLASHDGFAYVDFNGRTDPNMRVSIWRSSIFTGRVGYADASGNFQIRLQPMPIGTYTTAAAAGWLGGSPVAQINITVLGPPTTPPRPPLLPNQTFTWYMNWIADSIVNGTPQLSATAAAQVAAGAPYGSSLRQSLNHYAGHAGPQYLSVNDNLNALAGTTGLSNQEAAYQLCLLIESQSGGTDD